MTIPISRRRLLTQALKTGPILALGGGLLELSTFSKAHAFSLSDDLGPLQAPDANGLRLPIGYTSRIVAISEQPVSTLNGNSDYKWHGSPDGGACFKATGGGWIYVSNSEEYFPSGGVGALAFNEQGSVVAAYSILSGTVGNCAGGPTPWNTWLSCEEVDCGVVYECDPYGVKPAVKRPALGYFKHEAVAVDPERGQLYLTEDEKDGCLYRFTPDNGLPDLSSGILEVAHVNAEQQVSWLAIEDACPHKVLLNTRTRYQVPQATKFKGGEGIWYQKGLIIFSTKRDNRIWVLDVTTNLLKVLYDAAQTENAILSGVDNLTAMPSGDILVAEDGGNMQLVSLDAQGHGQPIIQVVGQESSEITGPAFSPNGKYLYFSSQRGKDAEKRLGITYQVWAQEG